KTGGGADAESGGVGGVLLDFGLVFVGVLTSAELGDIECVRLRVLKDGILREIGGVANHGVAQFPVLILLAGTARRFRCFLSVGMKIERQVATHEAHFAGVDVVLFQLGKSIAVILAAERALIVGELNHGHRSVVAAHRVPARSHFIWTFSETGAGAGVALAAAALCCDCSNWWMALSSLRMASAWSLVMPSGMLIVTDSALTVFEVS